MATMAATYVGDRIRVNASRWVRDADGRAAANDVRIRRVQRPQAAARRRAAGPDEVARAAFFFLSDESRAVTGELLKVDGGWSVVSRWRRPAEGLRPAASTLVRTVLGDIDPTELGVTYAHEHLVIDGGRPVEMSPTSTLGDVERMATEVGAAAALGLRAVVDAMPCDCGRNAGEARRAVAADRRPHRRADRAPPRALLRTGPLEPPARRETIADAVRRSTSPSGSTSTTTAGRSCDRTPHPGRDRQDRRQRGRPVGRATCRSSRPPRAPHRATGAPILTHCERGTGALEQVRLLADAWRRPGARRAQPRRQGRRPRVPPGARSRPARSPSTTGRSAGATRQRHARS